MFLLVYLFCLQMVNVIVDSSSLVALRAELKGLSEELLGLSMVDEFARYAHTKRQINKIKAQINAISTLLNSNVI